MSRSGVHVVEARYDSSWDRLISSLRYEQFRWLYVSNLCFMFAMMAQFLVRSVLAYDLTDDNAFALGIVNFVVAIPMLVVSPPGRGRRRPPRPPQAHPLRADRRHRR